MTHQETKALVLTYYGNGKLACTRCGFTDIRALSIDHINGHGNQHRKRNLKSSAGFYSWLIKNKYPVGFQTLCMNCQFIKRFENKEDYWTKKRKLTVWDKNSDVVSLPNKWKHYQLLKTIQSLPNEFDTEMVLQKLLGQGKKSPTEIKALRGYIRTTLHRLVKSGILIHISYGVYKKGVPIVSVAKYMKHKQGKV